MSLYLNPGAACVQFTLLLAQLLSPFGSDLRSLDWTLRFLEHLAATKSQFSRPRYVIRCEGVHPVMTRQAVIGLHRNSQFPLFRNYVYGSTSMSWVHRLKLVTGTNISQPWCMSQRVGVTLLHFCVLPGKMVHSSYFLYPLNWDV
ncbi:hypothetical protein PoB_000551100 [Plakobranchus ocellatus]|uniref:Secreted protein n=1 Tax=Plakobranchus ocellatus TaxID=259542 RepID=A0AAV3Y709_9GAST|nr:hypothetical protein PoB_000551100 [Plakobranchus ocellatus]